MVLYQFTHGRGKVDSRVFTIRAVGGKKVVREKEKELEGEGWEHLITHIANKYEILKQSESNENYEMKNIRNDNKQIINKSSK